ncbi:unnamed protein product [Rangifer tarandus platyrhynchus]|uniref:Uncharacterized protein n=1 Tax=Rangifer tarandus platyrhynchus TaxID=3082113 RepID=A0ABN8Y0X3_RANTA|nr:unnamed protein product [Rangifer tarandus platyrhynchus]
MPAMGSVSRGVAAAGSDAVTSYKFGFPPGFPPGRGLRAAQAPLAPILPSARAAAGTATAATRQCPAFTAASANHRPAPPGPARRHRPRSGRRKTWPLGGHQRPSWGRTPCPACAPARSSGPGAADPGAGVALGAQDAPPPPARMRRCPFKTSLLPGRGALRRPRRGGQRHPGYRAGDDDGPSGSSQPLRDARLAAAGRWAELGRQGRHAGHGRFALGAALSAPTSGPPHLLRVHGGAGRREVSQSAAADLGPPLESSRGAVREAELRGGRGAGPLAGDRRVRTGGGAGHRAYRLRLGSSAEVKGGERRGGARAARENRRGREEGGGAGSRWCSRRRGKRGGGGGGGGGGEQACPGDRELGMDVPS